MHSAFHTYIETLQETATLLGLTPEARIAAEARLKRKKKNSSAWASRHRENLEGASSIIPN
jgi:hypothetical protein